MKIAIDISPLSTGYNVRGTGFYLSNLKRSLLECFPENTYNFFTQIKELKTDIDVIHYPYFDPFFLTHDYSTKVSTVVTVHDLTPLKFPGSFPAGLKGKLKWQINKHHLKKVDAIITDSQVSKRDILQFIKIDDAKVHVIYLASGEEFKQLVLTQKEKKIMQQKYSLPEKFVLYVGDVTWNKNLPRLIKAIQKANVPLVMVGKALEEHSIDKGNKWNEDLIFVQNEIKLTSFINAVGFVSSADLVKLYNMATVFVMPSLYEGFGLPVIEAMSSGCPVVTTHEGSLREVADDACVVVDGYDTESIYNGVMSVFTSEKLRNDLSRRGIEHAKKFSWKKTAQETVHVYEKVL